MVPSDKEIYNAIQTGKLIVSPNPRLSSRELWSKVVLKGHLSTRHQDYFQLSRNISSVDLRDWKKDEKAKLKFYERSKERLELAKDSRGLFYTLHPHELVLVYTEEKFAIQQDAKLVGLVEGKSGLARLGLSVHVTAPIIHPGFGEKNGPQPIMLEIFNHGHLSIKIYPGMPACQFRFEQVYGNYIGLEIKGFAAGQPRGKKAA